MKNASRLLAVIFITSTLASPLHALTYKQWQGITGLGAIGGALAGVMIYQAMTEKKQEQHHPQEPLVIGHHNKPQKEKKSRSLLSSFCSGALGAATGALTLGWWFWSKTPQARQ